MQNNNYQTKHHKFTRVPTSRDFGDRKGSSPHQEMKQGFDKCVKGLRPIEQVTEDSTTQLYRVEHRVDVKRQLTFAENDAERQSDEEGRWQDDGGGSG